MSSSRIFPLFISSWAAETEYTTEKISKSEFLSIPGTKRDPSTRVRDWSVLRRIVYLMLIQYAMGPTKLAPCNFALKPHHWLKCLKTNLKFLPTVMKLPKNRFYAILYHVNLLLAFKHWNTVFAHEVLVQQHGAVKSNIIASYLDSFVTFWLKAMAQTCLWQEMGNKMF